MSSYSAADLAALDRRSLQKLCKRADVVAFAAERGESLRANAKTEQLVSQLTEFFTQINGDNSEEQQNNQQIDEQSSSAAEADEAALAAAAELVEEAAPAEAEMECTTAGAAALAEESAEQEQEDEAETEERMEETAAAAPASLLPASGLADELAAASADAHMEEEEDEDEDEMEPVGPLAGDIHMDDFPELPAEEEEERAAPAFAAAGADHERDAKEQEELEALEAEIGDLQAQLVQTEQPAAPVARAAKAAKKSVAPGAASKKKSIAPKKSVVLSVAAMADKRKSTKKVAAPAAAAAAAPVAAAAAPLFKKKAVAKKAAPAAAAAAPVTVAAAAEPVITIPTSFDFSSGSTTATVAAAVAPAAAPAPAVAAAASSGSSSMDAYWSLMAELDKRVVEKQRVAATAAAPSAVEDASAPAAAVAATPSAALGKKTTAKFDKIHKAAAHKSESIVDHYNKLNEKKRAAQMATPLASGLKRAKHAHHATAGTALPQPSPAPFVLAPMASPAAAVALPASGFTEGFKAVQTPGVAKRTRASLKKEKNRHVAPAPVVAPAKAAARKSVAAKKLAPAASPAAAESRPLFSSRVPVRPSASASAAVAPAPSTTFTQIACLEDVRAGSAASASASTAATAAAAKKKFDIAASLAKPVSWKMHKGKIGKATAAEGKAKVAAAAADKENAPVSNPFVAAAAEEKAGNPSKGVDAAFGFSFQPGVHAFTAPVAAPQPVLQVSKAQPSASAAGTSRRDGIKTVRMGADKDAKRSNFNANKQSSRNKAMAAARDRIAV